MKAKIILWTLALGASTCLLPAQDGNARPEGQPAAGRAGGPGGQSGFHLLPPPMLEQMNLTEEQQKQLTALETEVKAKLEKILTPEQRQQLTQMGQRQRPGGLGEGSRPQPTEGQPPARREGDAGGPAGPGGMGGPGAQGGGLGMPGGMGGGQRPSNPIIDALDLNKDGIIDADEIAKATESLKKLDKNNDGKLTTDEYRPQRPGGMGGPGAQGGAPGMRGQGRGPGGQGGPGGEGLPQRPAMER